MSIDTTSLAELCMRAMDAITDQFENHDDVEIRTCAVVVEVDSPNSSTFWWSCSDDRPWLLKALLYETENAIDDRQHQQQDVDD